MSSPRINVSFPAVLNLNASEKATLSETFKQDVIRTIRRRGGNLPPFPETNTSGTGPRPGKRKAGSKKAGKKK